MVRSMYAPTPIISRHALTATRTRADRLMPRDLASWNPRHCLVSVIDEPASAFRAHSALREAGFAHSDIRLAPAREFVALDDARRSRGLPARLIAGLRACGDESLITAEYVAEARRGHYIVIVFAPGDERTYRALEIVSRCHAHTMYYYGRWVIRGMEDVRQGALSGQQQAARRQLSLDDPE